jgi:hypothetical protein
MKIIVISYSFTGNNEALAASVANELSVDHIRISESKLRTMGSITMDMIFSRIPMVQPTPNILRQYDFILFFGPIWMGKVATPLRAYLKYMKTHPCRYGFLSISGGVDGTNTKLIGELKKKTGLDPAVLIDLHITDLISTDTKPSRKDTSSYQLNDMDIKNLTNTIIKSLENIT